MGDPPEILIVDDTPTSVQLLTHILEISGYRVRAATDGGMALQSVAAGVPDMILLDIKMPDMDGYEVCRRLKSDEQSCNIPVIFISALGEDAEKVKAFNAGGVDYITKPIAQEEVLARVRTHLGLQELTERLGQKVRERTAELTAANQRLVQEIAEREQAEQALRQAHDDLEHVVHERTAELLLKNRQLVKALAEHRRIEIALCESETMYRTIFETTASATFITEADGTISLVNTEFEKLSGCSKTATEGKRNWTEFVAPEDLARMKAYHRLRRIDPQAAPRNYETRVVDGNGRKREAFCTVAMLPGTSKSVVSLLDITELKEVEQSLRESEKRLRFLSSRLLSAQENERRRISMEIHDELGQNLAVLKLRISNFADELRKDQGRLKTEFKKTLKFIDRIIEDMRRLSRDLSPTIIQDLKLCGSLKWMVHDFRKHTNIHISLDMVDIDDLFCHEDQIVLYRIFQEALNNVRKHAQARHVSAVIHEKGGDVVIRIDDDGKGFDPVESWNRHVAKRGLGLAALDERARMLGGVFDIATQKDKGTRITIKIPTAQIGGA